MLVLSHRKYRKEQNTFAGITHDRNSQSNETKQRESESGNRLSKTLKNETQTSNLSFSLSFFLSFFCPVQVRINLPERPRVQARMTRQLGNQETI